MLAGLQEALQSGTKESLTTLLVRFMWCIIIQWVALLKLSIW